MLDFDRIRKDNVIKELDNYLDGLVSQISKLRAEVQNFRKDDEISRLNKEIEDMRIRSIHNMSDSEMKDAREFRDKHYISCKSNIQYILEGTGIGTSISVKCKKCGEVKNITDTSNW